MTREKFVALHRAQAGRGLLLLGAIGLLAGCFGGGDGDNAKYSAEIRRTTLGVPHIKADDWGSLGYGFGLAQAQDNLCTIAESFVTYRGERARWFGPEALLSSSGTAGRPRNLDADFFHRHVLSAEAVAAFRAAQPADVATLIEG